jgi:hypothetical protein
VFEKVIFSAMVLEKMLLRRAFGSSEERREGDT